MSKIEEFWKEDADRVNKMAKAAKKAGFVIDTKEGDPPDLEEDGSLTEKDDD